MGKKDLEELFELVRAGDVVDIRSERDAQTAAIFETPTPLGTTEPVVVASAENGSTDGTR